MPDKLMEAAIPPTVTNYLDKFGFVKWQIEQRSERKYNNIVVVPAVQEYENLKNLLNSLLHANPAHQDSTLILFVINNISSITQEVRDDNARSIFLVRSIMKKESFDELSHSIINSHLNIGLVDASSPGLEMPEKDGGVGYARKIGMDLALSHFDYHSKHKRILICLDADCVVQPNYFDAIVSEFNANDLYAGYVEYEHKLGDSEEDNVAIISYEIFLRYYVLGLKHANSPFAFDSIGSTMICDAESYIRIGGMNKRKAAEDFYFLEKLAKITSINKIKTTKIFPSPRRSWRVPFGTGQRMNRFFAGTHDEFSLIDPACFDILKMWLFIFMKEEFLSGQEYLAKAKSINESLYNFLVSQQFEESWNKILTDTKKKDQLHKQKQYWFDGFRTMKLLHHLRDATIPPINMFDALDLIFVYYNIKVNRVEVIPPWQVQLEYLDALKNLL
jgi:hypothetical protein